MKISQAAAQRIAETLSEARDVEIVPRRELSGPVLQAEHFRLPLHLDADVDTQVRRIQVWFTAVLQIRRPGASNVG